MDERAGEEQGLGGLPEASTPGVVELPFMEGREIEAGLEGYDGLRVGHTASSEMSSKQLDAWVWGSGQR